MKRAVSQDAIRLRFMELSAVEPNAALMFRRAVDDPAPCLRFRTAAAHRGLSSPRRYLFGEMDNPDRISKADDTGIPSVQYASANAMLIRSVAGPETKSRVMQSLRRKGCRRVIVAVVARKITASHRIWVNGAEFRRGQAVAA